jgi:hypothetical protein
MAVIQCESGFGHNSVHAIQLDHDSILFEVRLQIQGIFCCFGVDPDCGANTPHARDLSALLRSLLTIRQQRFADFVNLSNQSLGVDHLLDHCELMQLQF